MLPAYWIHKGHNRHYRSHATWHMGYIQMFYLLQHIHSSHVFWNGTHKIFKCAGYFLMYMNKCFREQIRFWIIEKFFAKLIIRLQILWDFRKKKEMISSLRPRVSVRVSFSANFSLPPFLSLLMTRYWLFRTNIRWAYGSWSFKCSHIILFSLRDAYIHQDDPSPESLTKSL